MVYVKIGIDSFLLLGVFCLLAAISRIFINVSVFMLVDSFSNLSHVKQVSKAFMAF